MIKRSFLVFCVCIFCGVMLSACNIYVSYDDYFNKFEHIENFRVDYEQTFSSGTFRYGTEIKVGDAVYLETWHIYEPGTFSAFYYKPTGRISYYATLQHNSDFYKRNGEYYRPDTESIQIEIYLGREVKRYIHYQTVKNRKYETLIDVEYDVILKQVEYKLNNLEFVGKFVVTRFDIGNQILPIETNLEGK